MLPSQSRVRDLTKFRTRLQSLWLTVRANLLLNNLTRLCQMFLILEELASKSFNRDTNWLMNEECVLNSSLYFVWLTALGKPFVRNFLLLVRSLQWRLASILETICFLGCCKNHTSWKIFLGEMIWHHNCKHHRWRIHCIRRKRHCKGWHFFVLILFLLGIVQNWLLPLTFCGSIRVCILLYVG